MVSECKWEESKATEIGNSSESDRKTSTTSNFIEESTTDKKPCLSRNTLLDAASDFFYSPSFQDKKYNFMTKNCKIFEVALKEYNDNKSERLFRKKQKMIKQTNGNEISKEEEAEEEENEEEGKFGDGITDSLSGITSANIEHRIEFTDIYNIYLKDFEESVTEFITSYGCTIEEFYEECDFAINDKFCALFEEHKHHSLVETILMSTDYMHFVDSMLDHARNNLEVVSFNPYDSHKSHQSIEKILSGRGDGEKRNKDPDMKDINNSFKNLHCIGEGKYAEEDVSGEEKTVK